MQQLSPMMRQYLEIKEKHKDCILFFRLGDFYEMFFDDAEIVSKELEITLTAKACGLKEKAPMCGVPFHSASTYIQKLINNGHKVAICEQTSDPANSKGLVDRDVIRIITKGTVVDSTMLDEYTNSYIAAIIILKNNAGIAYADISTGEFYAYSINGYNKTLADQITRINPIEIIYENDEVLNYISNDSSVSFVDKNIFSNHSTKEILKEHFQIDSLDTLGFYDNTLALRAAGGLLNYIYDTQKVELKHITTLLQHNESSNMFLDKVTRQNLEIVNNIVNNDKKGSLLWVLDKTCTAMGARCLKSWVEQPLLIKYKIEERLNIVEELTKDFLLVDSLRLSLKKVYDLERLLSKISYKSLNARDCLSFLRSLREIPNIIELITNTKNDKLIPLLFKLDPLDKLCELIEASIHPEPPLNISEGGFINDGFNKELDELRKAATHGKQWLLELEEKEKKETNIKNLKISYNKIFGYYIEITNSNITQVPLRYTRKQTLVNAERYTTKELQEIENKLNNSTQNSLKLEMAIFDEIRNTISGIIERIQKTADALKSIDVYGSLATVALDNNYIKPIINDIGVLDIKDGRHPVVEMSGINSEFIPNDTKMNNELERMLIITGPNMAGKSTYMRQNALIVLMAHIGSFVPATFANICITDRIFSRIGASDNLSGGQSTFMVEMTQTANIIRNATSKSLILLDEIGRGTSTFDGLSIAWSVAEHITQNIKAKTLFATHYHELSHLEGHLEGVKNYCISVKEYGNDIIFLRKIIPGGADKSYGIYVAKLAGIPFDVIKRAQKIQARLEASDINNDEISKSIIGKEDEKKYVQQDFFHTKHDELVEEIKKIDVMALTPMQAMTELFKISEKANKI